MKRWWWMAAAAAALVALWWWRRDKAMSGTARTTPAPDGATAGGVVASLQVVPDLLAAAKAPLLSLTQVGAGSVPPSQLFEQKPSPPPPPPKTGPDGCVLPKKLTKVSKVGASGKTTTSMQCR